MGGAKTMPQARGIAERERRDDGRAVPTWDETGVRHPAARRTPGGWIGSSATAGGVGARGPQYL